MISAVLIASLVALALGPLLHFLAGKNPAASRALDGFVFVAIGGMVGFHILPEAIEAGGASALILAGVGFFGPLLTDRWLHKAAERVHTTTLIVALAGLLMHAVLDGVILVLPDMQLTGLAIVLHRLPVGLVIWALLVPRYGWRAATAVLALLAVGTVLGYVQGEALMAALPQTAVAWFEALVAGSLLHVMLHPPVDQPRHQGWDVASGLGGLGGIALVLFLEPQGAMHAHGHGDGQLSEVFLSLALESAPALVVAYLIAGLLHVWLPKAGLSFLGRGSSLSQAARGVAFGLPLPLCSCGVIPVYRSLVLRGAPAPAAMGFFVATPELGLDAVLLSFPLLGAQVTGARVAAAVFVALGVGWLVGRQVTPRDMPPETATEATTAGWLAGLKEAVRVGYGSVVDSTMPWILFGLLIAAAITPLLTGPESILASIPAGAEVLVFALLGMPAYVCAAGATPLVAVLIAAGVSPGAGVAFLLTGPATNVTTFGVLSDLHGKRIAVLFGAAIAGFAVVVGYGINALWPDMTGVALPEHAMDHAGLFETGMLVALGLVVLLSLLRQGPRHFVSQVISATDDHDHSHGDGHDHDHGHPPAEKSCCAGDVAP